MKQISTTEFRRDLTRIKKQLSEGEMYIIFDYVRMEKIGVLIPYDKYIKFLDASRKEEL